MPWKFPGTPSVEVMITQAPLGEAPLWVRQAWIGLHLPTRNKREAAFLGFGVLSGPRGVLNATARVLLGEARKVEGFGVPALQAVEILGLTQPEAAEWWRANAAHMMKPGRLFVFDADACRLDPQ